MFEKYTADHGELYPRFVGGPGQMRIQSYVEEFQDLLPDTRMKDTMRSVAGRIVSRRTAGAGLIFYDIQQDGSKVQVVAMAQHAHHSDKARFHSLHAAMRKGDIIRVTGFPGRTKAGELSIYATEAALLAPCLHDIPEVLTDPLVRVRQRHIEMLVNNDLAHTLRIRAKIISMIRQFFDTRGFVEVETPVLSPVCGGARARPFVTRGNAADGDLFLRIAPELYLKQLVIGGMDRVYELGKQFRNEGVDATHNPEFTTCEMYQAYASINSLMTLTEDLLCGIGTELEHQTALIMRHQRDVVRVNLSAPFERLSFVDVIEDRCGRLPDLNDPDCAGRLLELCRDKGISLAPPHTPAVLLDRLGAVLVEPLCVQPTFVVDIPAALSPLAKRQTAKSELASRFELFIGGKEYCNAYEELNDPAEQRQRFREQLRDRQHGDDEAPLPDEAYCCALEYGLPPTGGWGLGVDRLVMLLAGRAHLREVIAFPHMRS